jgi:type IX secretion system PorP/SprF family membrane protein
MIIKDSQRSIMKIFLLLVSICIFTVVDLRAQQDPLYAQYFNNPILINPAFAGSTDRLFAGMAYRTQWSGIEGAPITFSFNSHVALADNKVGAGIVVVQDQLGEFKTSQYGGAFSYRVNLENSVSFSFGLQLGFVQYATNLKGVEVLSPDPRFTPFSETKFNTGAGLLLKSDRYAVGLSVPHLLANSIEQGDGQVQIYSQNYYAFGSYLFFLSEKIEFRPSTLLRLTKGTPLSADVNMNLTFNRAYTAGLFTRNLNTYGVLLQVAIKNVRCGYVFELPGKSSALNSNTHELSLALSLGVLQSHNSVNGF